MNESEIIERDWLVFGEWMVARKTENGELYFANEDFHMVVSSSWFEKNKSRSKS